MSSPPEYRSYMANLIALRTLGGELGIDEARWRPPLERHIKVMDERRIDIQLLSPRPVAMMQWERPYLVHSWTKTTNRVINYICEQYPDRYIGIAQLPQTPYETTEKCADELEDTVNRYGFVGGMVNPDPGADRTTPGMDREYWYPLYERSESLGAPLIVHPGITHDPRLDVVPHSYQYNNIAEETLCVMLLNHSDVFDRFPGLKIIVCHCGGALSRFIEHGQASGQAGGGSGGGPVQRTTEEAHSGRDTSNNLFIDSCCYEPYLLTAAIKQYGVDRVCFGTEAPGSGTAVLNPYTNKASDDLIPVFEGFDFLTNEDRKKILHDNAMRIFPLLAKSAALAGR